MSFWITAAVCVTAFLILSGIGVMLYITIPISKNVYNEQLVRTDGKKWGRECSAPENDEQLAMWNDGIAWADGHKDSVKEVSICSGGMNLYGEYYDFGSKECVIILPGRCESLMYSYYFAKPYEEMKINVLVIDTRCHGKSDGKYSSIGLFESYDLKNWMKYMETEFDIKGFWLHGICIGSAAALLAVSSEDCTKNIRGIVLEGCFVNFRESFKQHMREKKKPVFPVLDLVMHQIKKNAKVDVKKSSPVNAVKKIHYPILFLFGKQDIFSVPEMSKKLYAACASERKRIVWFDKGGHSHLRINNTENYDNSIKDFIKAYEK